MKREGKVGKTTKWQATRAPWRPVSTMGLLTLFLVVAMPAAVNAQFAYITTNNTITITRYLGSEADVAIPSTINGLPVTRIGDQAFNNYSGPTSVTIPASVSSIGSYAFGYSSGLNSITVDALNPYYSSLDGVLFNKSQTALIQYPRSRASGYAVPGSVTNIGDGAFCFCNGLSWVSIPANVTSIGNSAFTYCRRLPSVAIPSSVKSIGNSAFAYCDSLSSVAIADGVTSVGALAFTYCYALTSVTVPKSVTSIGDGAFTRCDSLKEITLDELNPAYSMVDGVLFNKKQTTLVRYPANKASSYAIPSSVTSIGNYAFYYCTGLTSITIPNSVTNIGDLAFYFCPGLSSLIIPNSVRSIGNSAFNCCQYLINVSIPNSLTNLGDWAFYNCVSLSSLTIPTGISNIGERTFSGCIHLTSVTIPNSITSIGDSAFSYCEGLSSVTIPGSVSSIGNSAFANCPRLTRITADASNSYFSSVDGVLFNKNQTTLVQYPGGKVGSYTVPASVTAIAGGAFEGCSGLSSVMLPNSLTSIGDSAFQYCYGLASVTLPNSLTNIGDWAFYCCSGVTSVFIPNSVVTVGSYAFANCSGLTNLTIPTSLTSIRDGVFSYCSRLTGVTIPSSVTNIGDDAFYDCSGLTSVTLPANVSSIGDYAFYGCSSLTAVYFQGNAPVADTTVFSGDNNATVYYLPLTTGWGSWFGGRPTVLHGQAVDTFNPGADGAVFAMAVQTDGKVLVGGAFTSLAGQPRNHIGRLNPDGTLDVAFAPNADGDVVSLNVQEDGKILVGGSFGQLGGAARSHLGRLNADGTLDAAFNAETDGNVSTLALDREGRILVAGSFSRLNGQTRSYLGRVNVDGTLDTAFAPQPDNAVSCLAVQADGKILVGGSFTNLGGRACPYLGRLNADGTLDMNFLGGADGSVNLVSLQADGKIYAAGSFTRLSGVECSGLGRLNSDGSLDAGNPGINFPVQSLAMQANGNVLVGGGAPYQVSRFNGLFHWDSSSFALAADGNVSCLALQPDGGILVGGDFQSFAGQPRDRLDRFFDENLPTEYFTYDGTNITWQRFGSSPMVSRTSFEICTNGTDWVYWGAGVHVPNGEQLTVPALPANARVRARGFIQGGLNAGSGWFVEASLVASEFTCVAVNGTITITGYRGADSDVTIPDSLYGLPVRSLGNYAFYSCSGLKSVTIPAGVTSMGYCAFNLCTNLTSVTIPASLSSIGWGPFDGCTHLITITADPSNLYYSSVNGVLFNKNQTELLRCPGGRSGVYTVSSNVISIGSDAFGYCTGLTGINIPDGVTSIGDGAFGYCTALTNINIPNSVTGIGHAAFWYCTNLPGINIPNSVTGIGNSAFLHCSGLTNVTIPASVTYLGVDVFLGCGSLREAFFQGDAPSDGDGAFNGTPASVYYCSGTKGWSSTFGGRPTALWNPVLVSQPPSSLGLCPGGSALLSVVVNGKPPFVYQWRKNGLNLTDSATCTGSTTAQLSLFSIQDTGTANYDVVITNSGGCTVSAVTVLTVSVHPALIAPVLASGSVVGATVLDGGCGYSTAPLITFIGRGGTGAAGYAQVGNGSITNIVITSPGSGYPAETTVQVGSSVVYPTLSIGPVQNSTAPPGQKAFRFNASNLVAGQKYELQGSTNLSSWTPVQTFLAPQTNWVLTNTASPGRMFFRLRMVQ